MLRSFTAILLTIMLGGCVTRQVAGRPDTPDYNAAATRNPTFGFRT